MKRFSEQLNTKAKTLKLQAAEKRELRARVVSYMEYHPMPNAAATKRSPATPSPYAEQFKMVRVPFVMIARWSAVTAALLLVIIPVLAEKAVPGDGLYAVKVQFNEELRGQLSFTPYQKIEWETERLNRRIAEARLLANEGRLTDEVEAEVAAAVKTHTENAQREIEILREEDADEATLATMALSTTLQVQSASFRDEGADSDVFGDDSHSTKLLSSVIDETLLKQEASNTSSSIPSYDKLMARVELNTTRAHELLASLELNSNSAEYTDMTRRIEDIERSIQEAISFRESDDTTARATLVDSLQRTQRLIVFMTEIEVSQDFNVEEIVPVVLTPDEKEAKVKEYKSNISKRVEVIENSLASNNNPKITEKVTYSLNAVKDIQVELATTVDFEMVKELSMKALALADDTVLLLEQQGVKTTKASSTKNTTDDKKEEVVDDSVASSSVEEFSL